MLRKLALFALASGLVASACYHFAPRRAEASAPKLYAERCSTCHGPKGRGDGLGGQSLDPKPRDFANAVWQASTSDERIRRTIREGGAALGLNPLMPAQPDLSPAQLQELVAYIRAVGARLSGSSEEPRSSGAR